MNEYFIEYVEAVAKFQYQADEKNHILQKYMSIFENHPDERIKDLLQALKVLQI